MTSTHSASSESADDTTEEAVGEPPLEVGDAWLLRPRAGPLGVSRQPPPLRKWWEIGFRVDRKFWGAWSHVDGDPVLVTGGPGLAVTVWDGREGSVRHEVTRGERRWGAWSTTASSSVLVTGLDDGGGINLWSPADNAQRTVPTANTGSTDAWGTLSRSGDNQILATGGNRGVTLWPVADGITNKRDEYRTPFDPRWGVWSPTQEPLLAFGGGETDHVEVLQIVADESALSISPVARSEIPALWGQWGLVNGRPTLALGTSDGAVHFWDVGTDTTPELPFRSSTASSGSGSPHSMAHTGAVLWGAWTEMDGVAVLATGGVDGTVRFWDGQTGLGRGTQLMTDDSGSPTVMLWGAWAQVGPVPVPVLAVGGGDGRLWLWTGPGEAATTTLPSGHADGVEWGAWADVDGVPVLATGGGDGTVRLWDLVIERSIRRHPNYRSDDSQGADRLDRLTEATALADLLLSRSARPPLAVGLFGEWGEGKSYFLGLLMDRVAAIAKGREQFAHHDVRQVRFNAWHYAETDLWASLVTEIFTQRNRAADERGVAAEQGEQSRLVAEIIADRRLPERIAAEQARAQKLRDSLKPPDWTTLPPDLTAAALTNTADPDLVARTYRAATAPLAWLRMGWMRTTGIWRAIPRWARLMAAMLIAATMGLVVAFVLLPGLLPRILTLTLGFLPALGAFGVWTATREQIGKALITVKAVQQKAGTIVEGWQRQVETALTVSEANIGRMQRELQNLTAAGQLAGFISDRAPDQRYRQSLGLMTQIREDFQTMSALLTRDKEEFSARRLKGLDQPDGAGNAVPRIDRIVLYIDDLDRCPPHRVVELLEAVHLLLAVPLFVVVVAVDPRWLMRAIALHYRDILSTKTVGSPAHHAADVDPDHDEYWASTPAQYLEKIFQLVFSLPSMTTEGYWNLLDGLIGPRADVDTSAVYATLFGEQTPHPSAEPPTSASPPTAEHAFTTDAHAMDTAAVVHTTSGGFGGVPLPEPPIVDRGDPLAFDATELTLFALLGPPLISTPRAVKRLANSYGLFSAISRQRDPDASTSSLPAMVLLAALIGFPSLGSRLLTHLHNKSTAEPDLAWGAFVKGLLPTESTAQSSASSNAAAGNLSPIEAENWRVLANALNRINQQAYERGCALPEAISEWHRWMVLVGRLSFPAGSVVARLQRTN